MQYKLLCSDLDGTLLSTKSDVDRITIEQVTRLKTKIRIVLVSARMPCAMTYLQESLGIVDYPMICYNGALIKEGEKVIDSVVVSLAEIITIKKIIDGLPNSASVGLGLYYGDEWSVPTTSPRVEKEIKYTKTTPKYKTFEDSVADWKTRGIPGAHKIMVMNGDKEVTGLIYDQLEAEQGLSVTSYRSNDNLIEISPKSVSKATAISLLFEAGESFSDVIAFGDNYNDLEMLKQAGYGVAMGNARETVKAVANHVTLDHTDHGVAVFLKENL